MEIVEDFFPTFPWNITFRIPPKKWYIQQAYFIVLARFLLLDMEQTIVTILYFFWILPSRRLHYLSGQSLTALCHLPSTEMLSDVQRNPSVFQFVSTVSCPGISATEHGWEKPGSVHFAPYPSGIYTHWWKPAEPSLQWTVSSLSAFSYRRGASVPSLYLWV